MGRYTKLSVVLVFVVGLKNGFLSDLYGMLILYQLFFEVNAYGKTSMPV